MNMLQPWHLIILVLVVVVLFGAKRLPDAARSIGKSMKIFKAETKDMRGEQSEEGSAEADTAKTGDKQIPAATIKADAEVTDGKAADAKADDAGGDQVEQLQRQLDELKQQQSAEQAQKNG